MKKILATVAMMMTIAISASAMSYTTARQQAYYLSDKMAYELGLSAEQYDAVYEINLDYMLSVTGSSDVFGYYWNRRNDDLRYVLTVYQYDLYTRARYFYRPLEWSGTTWRYNIYTRYTNKSLTYNSRPTGYRSYKGGNNRQPANYYAGRNYNQPTATSNHGTTNWRTNATGSSTNAGNSNWRRNATGNPSTGGQQTGNWRKGSSGTQTGQPQAPRQQPSTGNTPTRSTNTGANGGQFGGRR